MQVQTTQVLFNSDSYYITSPSEHMTASNSLITTVATLVFIDNNHHELLKKNIYVFMLN